MKRKNVSKLFAFLFIIILGSCEEGNDDNSNSSIDKGELTTITVSGNWTISYFFDTDKEETNNYTGYVFTFHSTGELTAANGIQEIVGSWSITDSDSSDDDGSSDVDFNILFSSPSDFEELSDDWDIVSYSDTRIELIDISGGNGGTDNLVFEKD